LLSTVSDSWWLTEELSETCRVSFQNKCEKLVHLVGFYCKEICHDARSHVTMHGRMNVKYLHYAVFLHEPYQIREQSNQPSVVRTTA
jgi:hypothetical protein